MTSSDLMPPYELRAAVGLGLSSDVWNHWGELHAARLKPYSDQSILDLGCGCGRIATHLLETHTGPYVGLDVDPKLIEWCQQEITPRFPNFTFVCADVFNLSYNPYGAIKAADYKFPFEDGQFDVAIAASLFTHLMESETENYYRELARVIRPGGTLLASHYLLDDEAERAMESSATALSFPSCQGVARLLSWQVPSAAVAYPEEWVLAALFAAGFAPRVEKSTWRESQNPIVDQDWVIATR